MEDIFVVIPTLNPNPKLLDPFLEKLKTKTNNILVYDDGSRSEYNDYFKKMEKNGILVLHHYVNLGKGRAMKDAFNYLLLNYPNLKGVVTADSDGQHDVNDIVKCAKEVIKCQDSLILGCRNFKNDDVPKRSRFGNLTTCKVFKIFLGLNISDTQTGLRGLSKDVMLKFMETKGERFEYETNQLIETISKDVPIKEVTIKTIYVDGNSESHFNPLKDSLAIYKQFFKYIVSSVSSFIIDIILFTILSFLITGKYYVLLSTIFARIISSIYNYFINRNLVFKKSNKLSLFKYGILTIIQMFVSAFAVNYLFKFLNINLTLLKIIVDLIIFIVNFVIQREFVFKKCD